MNRLLTRKTRLPALLATLALLGAACASSSDPESWADAEAQEGFPVKTNFVDACIEANSGEEGFDATAAGAYCRCSFDEVRETLEFDEFDALDDALRNNPDPNQLEGVAGDAWRVVEPLFEACAADATA